MKQTVTIVITLLFTFISCSHPVRYDERLTGILLELDETILGKETYENNKKQRVQGIMQMFDANSSLQRRYDVCGKLLDEYFDYNLDSAMVYAKYKLSLAHELNDSEALPASVMNLASVCTMTGMLHEAFELLDRLSESALSRSLQIEYYSCYHILYKHLGYVCTDPELLHQYNELKEGYRHKVLDLIEGDELRRLTIEASLMRNRKDYEGVVCLLRVPYEEWDISMRDRSTLSYLIARAYQDMGDMTNAIYYYAAGSICDIQIPVNEHESLYTLSSIIFDKGDLERAYRYINCSMDGVLKINSRKNIYNINQLLPLISQSYNLQIEQQKDRLSALVTGISLLLILLVMAIAAVYKSFKRTSRARRQLNHANEELQKANGKLTRFNHSLMEANSIKETYLGRYLDLCSNYMSGVEQYRVHLNNVLRKDGAAEVARTLKSGTYMKDELDKFYTNFDVTFLHLFPDFVDRFNNLLQEEKRISLKQGELLNTELRVFALIRLGITDSVKIAEFLRRSTSTIYNYRVKMRNAALNSRQDFEKQVAGIGSVDGH